MNGLAAAPTSNGPIDESFSTILNELRAHCKHCSSIYSAPNNVTLSSSSLNVPVFGYFGVYLAGNYVDVLICALESIRNFVDTMAKNGVGEQSSNGVAKTDGIENGAAGGAKLTLPSDQEVQQLLQGK